MEHFQAVTSLVPSGNFKMAVIYRRNNMELENNQNHNFSKVSQKLLILITSNTQKPYLELRQTSTMEIFVNIFDSLKLLAIFVKSYENLLEVS